MQQRTNDKIYFVERSDGPGDWWDDDHSTIGVCEDDD